MLKKKTVCVLKSSAPLVLSLKGGGTDGHGEAEGVTKLLVPYVLVLHLPPSNALSPRCHTKSLSLCFTVSAGHTTAISSLCLTTITFLQNLYRK